MHRGICITEFKHLTYWRVALSCNKVAALIKDVVGSNPDTVYVLN